MSVISDSSSEYYSDLFNLGLSNTTDRQPSSSSSRRRPDSIKKPVASPVRRRSSWTCDTDASSPLDNGSLPIDFSDDDDEEEESSEDGYDELSPVSFIQPKPWPLNLKIVDWNSVDPFAPSPVITSRARNSIGSDRDYKNFVPDYNQLSFLSIDPNAAPPPGSATLPTPTMPVTPPPSTPLPLLPTSAASRRASHRCLPPIQTDLITSLKTDKAWRLEEPSPVVKPTTVPETEPVADTKDNNDEEEDWREFHTYLINEEVEPMPSYPPIA